MSLNKSLISNGFKEDCEQLITRFERADDIRFETFCEIWKAMKFSLVFAGRPNFLELLEFCEDALNICKQFLLLPLRFKERIGGLYLLYGIYYKMPINQFKIRVKLDDWQSIMELHSEIKEAEHLDANYILCKLIVDNAFQFCIFDLEFGLEKHYRVRNSQCFNPYSVLPTMKNLTDKHQILSEINNLSKIYEEKKKLLGHSGTTSSLTLFNPKIAEEITKDIQEFEEQRRNKQMKDVSDLQNASNASTLRKEQGKSELKSKSKVRSLLMDDFETDSNDSDTDEIVELNDTDEIIELNDTDEIIELNDSDSDI